MRRVALGLAGLGVAAVALVVVSTDRLGCSSAEKEVFAQLPHYGGVRLEPESNEGSCWASYSTVDPPEKVLIRYRDRMSEQGWTVEAPLAIPTADAEGRPLPSGAELHARRDGFSFVAGYEGLQTAAGAPAQIYVSLSN